jgi:hypothetical protein
MARLLLVFDVLHWGANNFLGQGTPLDSSLGDLLGPKEAFEIAQDAAVPLPSHCSFS